MRNWLNPWSPWFFGKAHAMQTVNIMSIPSTKNGAKYPPAYKDNELHNLFFLPHKRLMKMSVPAPLTHRINRAAKSRTAGEADAHHGSHECLWYLRFEEKSVAETLRLNWNSNLTGAANKHPSIDSSFLLYVYWMRNFNSRKRLPSFPETSSQ